MKRQARLWETILALGLTFLWVTAAHAGVTVYYYYTNSLRSAVVETDAQGTVIERTYYAPYGQVLNRAMRDGPGYSGHEEDPATGLNYMQQRYYDPQAGRFLSTDPVQVTANGASFNRYWYAKDNPYRYTDPDGRDITEALGGLFYETASFVTGNGFHGSQIVGALKDGYNGEGGGVLHAVAQDATTLSVVAGGVGALKGVASLVLLCHKHQLRPATSAAGTSGQGSHDGAREAKATGGDRGGQVALHRTQPRAGGSLRVWQAPGVERFFYYRPSVPASRTRRRRCTSSHDDESHASCGLRSGPAPVLA